MSMAMPQRKRDMPHAHAPTIRAPFYAADDDGLLVHRYQDANFVTRFLADAQAGRLQGSARQAWRREDRFGKYAESGEVCLRQAVHKTFYMVCAEVCCDRLGQPAFDPAHIESAGMVIRRGTPKHYRIWKIVDDQAVGWHVPAADEDGSEPDRHRRQRRRRLIAEAAPAVYNGEQVHPLQAKLFAAPDTTRGKARSHTLLFGYLPLGGTLEGRLDDSKALPSEAAATGYSPAGRFAELDWPFGSGPKPQRDADESLAEANEMLAVQHGWDAGTGWQIRSGYAQKPMLGLLEMLLFRFHVEDAGIADNEALRNLLQGWELLIGPRYGTRAGDHTVPVRQRHSFIEYLERHADAIRHALAKQPAGADREPMRLPNAAGMQLELSDVQCRQLREQIVLRSERSQAVIEAELPLPRFGQGKDDIYYAQAFLRYRDNCGCERVVWGPPSKHFRVASVLDPEAARPSVIQLPELADVRRGFARGVTFLTPKSLADMLNKVSPDMDMKRRSRRSRPRWGFILSFSIPVVTICAMMILMVLINVLNLFLGWLPWAILKIPRRIG